MRCTPTTSLSAVFCRTSSARSAPRNEMAPTVVPSGTLNACSSGGRPTTIVSPFPGISFANARPSERIAVVSSSS